MQRRSFSGLLAAGLAAPGAAFAQDAYPSQPIRWILGYPAGGGSDITARTLSDSMRATLGQPLLIDNRPGAATNIAGDLTAKSRPDGYTIMSVDPAICSFNEHLFSKLPFDPAKDFTYIGGIGVLPLMVVVHPDFPARTMREWLAYVKAHPGKVDYASVGNGSPHHLTMEMLKHQNNLFMTHIPYRGGAPALQDLMGGQVKCMVLDMAGGVQAIRAGKVRALAISTPKRSALLPDVPTFMEAGLPNSEVQGMQGLAGPAGMPAPVVAKLSHALSTALKDPAVLRRLQEIGLEPTPLTGEQFTAHVRSEARRWGPIIKAAGVKLD